ncbi:MAG: stage III sporulation protein AF [Clostridia bacterium]|nr:stage III sporulation protein AF [Clostridia bacterium]
MIEWISRWAEQIVVAVIIATVIEMILPNGNNKKYVKVVIGIYILFTIISPIITKISGKNLIDLEFDYQNYLENTDTYQAMSQNLSNNNDKNIKQIYIQNLRNDIKNKLLEKGYNAKTIEININLEDTKEYGKINNIYLQVVKSKEEVKQGNITNVIIVNTIENITIGNGINNKIQESKDEEDLKDSEINEIKSYLSGVYEVNQKNIQVNKKGG